MSAEELSIKVNIGDRHYPLKINAGEEEIVRKAAKLINEKAKVYSEVFSVKDKQDAISMAALEIATDALNQRVEGTGSEDPKALETAKEIEQLLNKALQA